MLATWTNRQAALKISAADQKFHLKYFIWIMERFNGSETQIKMCARPYRIGRNQWKSSISSSQGVLLGRVQSDSYKRKNLITFKIPKMIELSQTDTNCSGKTAKNAPQPPNKTNIAFHFLNSHRSNDGVCRECDGRQFLQCRKNVSACAGSACAGSANRTIRLRNVLNVKLY